MKDASAWPTDAIERILDTYGDTLYRICLILLKNDSDAQDVIQETMIKYCQKAPLFTSGEHEKAWLIKVSTNQCRDLLRFRKQHPLLCDKSLETFPCPSSSDSGILEALSSLPEKYKLTLTLYYVEEYRIEEIAGIIGKTVRVLTPNGRNTNGFIHQM
jgi:RNA polymerase sigma-70 factor (ECF subfamily)